MTRVPPSAWCGIDTFAKTDGGVFFEFGCSSEIDLDKKGSTSPRWRSNRFSSSTKKKKKKESFAQVSPIGRKVGEQWAIRLQKLPKLAPTSMEIADASDNQPFLGLISKIGTNFGSTAIIADDGESTSSLKNVDHFQNQHQLIGLNKCILHKWHSQSKQQGSSRFW